MIVDLFLEINTDLLTILEAEAFASGEESVFE